MAKISSDKMKVFNQDKVSGAPRMQETFVGPPGVNVDGAKNKAIPIEQESVHLPKKKEVEVDVDQISKDRTLMQELVMLIKPPKLQFKVKQFTFTGEFLTPETTMEVFDILSGMVSDNEPAATSMLKNKLVILATTVLSVNDKPIEDLVSTDGSPFERRLDFFRSIPKPLQDKIWDLYNQAVIEYENALSEDFLDEQEKTPTKD